MMGKLEISAIVIGVIAGAVWYWWRYRKATSEPNDSTVTTKGGGGRGGLKR